MFTFESKIKFIILLTNECVFFLLKFYLKLLCYLSIKIKMKLRIIFDIRNSYVLNR